MRFIAHLLFGFILAGHIAISRMAAKLGQRNGFLLSFLLRANNLDSKSQHQADFPPAERLRPDA